MALRACVGSPASSHPIAVLARSMQKAVVVICLPITSMNISDNCIITGSISCCFFAISFSLSALAGQCLARSGAVPVYLVCHNTYSFVMYRRTRTIAVAITRATIISMSIVESFIFRFQVEPFSFLACHFRCLRLCGNPALFPRCPQRIGQGLCPLQTQGIDRRPHTGNLLFSHVNSPIKISISR
ncbi:hypothetical protein LCGC14_3153350 [marine sediment metagenome]|uniref:Uncharacterized protein n=1 Tax=marine sediment metagenome TaxID=412755 RepID=A0A0F8YHV7_9ZZZZ